MAIAICILLSVLAFCAGFIFAFISMAKCSQEKWERMKKVVDDTREKTGAND